MNGQQMPEARPGCGRFGSSMATTDSIIGTSSSTNDNGPTPCDEGPLGGLAPDVTWGG
jgi:hypothetical protein